MMKLAWIFALLPLSLGTHDISNDDCMSVASSYPITFTSLVNGSTLNVCAEDFGGNLQCCSQSDEDALGMTLNTAIRYNVTLGIELQQLQTRTMNYEALSNLQMSLINDVLRPLMNYSVRREGDYPFDNLDRVREEVLDNINSVFSGNMKANLTEEIVRYFTEGISGFYVNFTFQIGEPGNTLTLSDSEMTCAIDAIYEHLFPPVEQAKLASLGNNLQQIAVAFEVARALMSSTATIFAELQNFTVTPTCTNVWTERYACPLCAGEAIPLCAEICDDVLIGCMSSLQQVIVQLNALLEFANASVSSLISGNPYGDINVNNVGDLYTSAFETSLTRMGLLDGVINNPEPSGANCGIMTQKRSVDYFLVRHKRQSAVVFPDVTINQSLVTMINDDLLPTLVNVSLDSDRIALCNFLMANGSDTSCTIGVDDDSSYPSNFNSLEIADQGGNPAGYFNLTQLREQARPLTYAVTELLTDRSDIMMLYENVLPGRDIPNLDFLEPTPTPTISMSATATVTDTPRPTPTGDGGATAVSFSLFIMLVSLLCASIFVN